MPQKHLSDLSLRRFGLSLGLAHLTVVGLLIGVGWLGFVSTRAANEARAADTVQNAAEGLAAELAAELRLIDNALATVAAVHRANHGDEAGRARIEAALVQQKALLPQVDAMRIAGPDGIVRYGLTGSATPADLSDRDYFAAARDQAQDRMVISEPLQGRIIRKWGVIFARRVPNADGGFGGVVYTNLSSERLLAHLDRVDTGDFGAVSLRTGSLRLIARVAPAGASDADIGTSHVSRELTQALAENRDAGWFRSQTALDGIERVSAYHRLPGYDVLVLVGLASQEVFGPWRQNVWWAALLLLVSVGTMAATSLAIYRHRKRHWLAERRIAQLLHEQQLMLNNEIVGMTRVKDRIGRWKNRALEQMFGYEPDELQNKPARLLYLDDESYERAGAEAYAGIRRDGRFRTQLQMRRKDGSRIWIDLSGAPVSDEETLWMFVDITAMKQDAERHKRDAQHDVLTGLVNRAVFDARLRKLLLRKRTTATLSAVCFLDLDGFKQVNDSFGHATGDQVLVEVSRRLIACLRPEDIVCRQGGDEFALVLALVDGPQAAQTVLERVLAALREPMDIDGVSVAVGASIGYALAPTDANDAELLLKLADEAMYAAKRAGKNCAKAAVVGNAAARDHAGNPPFATDGQWPTV